MDSRKRRSNARSKQKQSKKQSSSPAFDFHISSIQYRSSGIDYPSSDSEISSGDEDDYQVLKRKRDHSPEKTRKKRKTEEGSQETISLRKLSTRELKNQSLDDLFPYKKVPFSSHLIQEEDSDDESYRKRKSRSFKKLEKNYLDLGGEEEQLHSGMVLENRPYSMFSRRNKLDKPRTRSGKFRRKSVLWHREYEDRNTGEKVSDTSIQRRAKLLRRRLSGSGLKGKLSEFQQTLRSFDSIESNSESVPYSQLREEAVKTSRKHKDFPKISRERSLVFTTMDNDIRPLSDEKPIKEGTDIFRGSEKTRMVAVPYIYDYDFPEVKNEKKRGQLKKTTFMVSANDGSNRRLQSSLGGENIYAPEPLNMTRISNNEQLNKLSFLEKKRGKQYDKKNLVLESSHLRSNMGIKDNEVEFTRSSYLTEPQDAFKKEILGKSKKYQGKRLMNTLLRDHPQSHSKTNRIAKTFTDGTDTSPFTNPVKSLVSERIKPRVELNDDGVSSSRKGKDLSELAKKNELIQKALKGNYTTGKGKKTRTYPQLPEERLSTMVGELEPRISKYTEDYRQETLRNKLRFDTYNKKNK